MSPIEAALRQQVSEFRAKREGVKLEPRRRAYAESNLSREVKGLFSMAKHKHKNGR